MLAGGFRRIGLIRWCLGSFFPCDLFFSSLAKPSKINIRGVLLPLFSLARTRNEAKHLKGLWIFLVSVGRAWRESTHQDIPLKLFSFGHGWDGRMVISLRSACISRRDGLYPVVVRAMAAGGQAGRRGCMCMFPRSSSLVYTLGGGVCEGYCRLLAYHKVGLFGMAGGLRGLVVFVCFRLVVAGTDG